jgi:GrpB-like predicted nucleotidyltransferase (UPF0157 family)
MQKGSSMSDPIMVVAYDPAWPGIFRQVGAKLRAALGGVALRIDHIGSTAVPGLAAKPIVDVQISVERLEPVEPFRSPLEAAGFVYRAANTERTKRYFREPPGQRRTHLHVRRAGSFSEQLPLLLRDFLRAHPAAALDYGRRKQALAARFAHDRHGYQDAKVPITWELLRRADEWAQQTGWEPGPSDA